MEVDKYPDGSEVFESYFTRSAGFYAVDLRDNVVANKITASLNINEPVLCRPSVFIRFYRFVVSLLRVNPVEKARVNVLANNNIHPAHTAICHCSES